MAEDRLLTPEEVADRLAISPLTAVRWMRSGRLPGGKLGGKIWRMKESALQSFIMAQPTAPETIPQAISQAAALHDVAHKALAMLVPALFPEGQPVAPGLTYGWQEFPLAEVNDTLREYGWVIHATKGRKRDRLVTCTTPDGRLEGYGIFECRRVTRGEGEPHASRHRLATA